MVSETYFFYSFADMGSVKPAIKAALGAGCQFIQLVPHAMPNPRRVATPGAGNMVLGYLLLVKCQDSEYERIQKELNTKTGGIIHG